MEQVYYLGEYGSPESQQRYAQLIAEKWVECPDEDTARVFASQKRWLSIDDLIARFMIKHVQHHYLNREGKPSERYKHIQVALRLLHDIYGSTPVNEFGPKRFKVVREQMIERGIREQEGYARSYVNDQMSIIRNFFRWGVEDESVPVDVYQSLAAVQQLRKGRDPRVREKVKVLPVSQELVFSTLPYLSPQLAGMIQIQLHTAMRPDEVTIMRPCDIDMRGDIWTYLPQAHKTEHHDISRTVFIGPKCQDIIRPWLDRPADAYLFSPREVALAARARHRKTPTDKPDKMDYFRGPREHYDDETYSRALRRVCERHGIERWTPNQLRHTAATFIREVYGLEAAKIILGHRNAVVTAEFYAEKDMNIAKNIMKEIG